jgi:hypothetical protein
MQRKLYVIILVCLAILITACTNLEDIEAGQLTYQDIIGTLEPGHSFGQVFSYDQPGLTSITLWMSSSIPEFDRNSIILGVELYQNINDETPIFDTSYQIKLTNHPSPIEIKFQPIKYASDSFYIKLRNAASSINIHGSSFDIYPNGFAVADNQPQKSDLAFKLSYRYTPKVINQDLGNLQHHFGLVVPLFVIFLFPGWIGIKATRLNKNLDFGEKMGVMIAISLSFYPILLLWTTQIGFSWQPGITSVMLFLTICVGIVLLYYALRLIKQLPNFKFNNLQFIWHKLQHISFIDVSLICVFLVTLATRLVMVRGLTFPPWVDSIHHALFTRLIIQMGKLPSSVEPILSIQSTDYHLGFHSISAFFIWLSGMTIPGGILLLGQVLNAMFVFPVYLLGKTLTQNRLAGLSAAVITSFFTPLPAYYTSWGRYTQMTALLLLPAGYFLFKLAINTDGSKRTISRIVTSFVWGGLFLIHYRVASFLGCLVLSTLVIEGIGQKKFTWKTDTGSFLLIIGITCIWVFPWLVPAIQQTFLQRFVISGMKLPSLFNGFNKQYLTAHDGIYTLILAGIGFIIGLFKRKPVLGIVSIWIGLMLFLANLGALGLPGGSFVNNGSVAITLFLPISVLGGSSIADLEKILTNTWFSKYKNLSRALVYFFGISIVIFGARRILTILNPSTVLAYRADFQAISWINKNIPKTEKFLVSPFIWGYGLYAGSDGGYWISALAGNETIPPPVLYGLDPRESALINSICEKVIQAPSNTQAIYNLLKEYKIQYIYIGVKPGVLKPQTFMHERLFSIVYQNLGVWIFKLIE